MLPIRKYLSNLLGWRTKRKIIVFESDDWGSIRTNSKDAYNKMMSKGLHLDRSIFTRFDILESNYDLENLFEVLSKYRDSIGRHPVFTSMCIVANPDFDKIRSSNFSEYHYESFLETCKKYPVHDKVGELWNVGKIHKLFIPQLHGREHLNVVRWMRLLQSGNEGLSLAFQHYSFGASWFKGLPLPEYLAAFHPLTPEEIVNYDSIIRDAGKLFIEICGYKPKHFIASNSPEPKSLEKTLFNIGVRYLTRYKFHQYPLGNEKYSKQLNWMGKRNHLGQIYLTRNVAFEPSDPSLNDWVDTCLSEISNAFFFQKPAIISTHRVNYVGGIEPQNADRGLNSLKNLLREILKKWPEVEFMTSDTLGDIIANDTLKR